MICRLCHIEEETQEHVCGDQKALRGDNHLFGMILKPEIDP